MERTTIRYDAFDLKAVDNAWRVPVPKGRAVTVRAVNVMGVWDDTDAKLLVRDATGGVAVDFAEAREIPAGGGVLRLCRSEMRAVEAIEIRLTQPETDEDPAYCDLVVTIEDETE